MLEDVVPKENARDNCVSVTLSTGHLELNSADEDGDQFREALQADQLVHQYIGRINPHAPDVSYMFTIFANGDRVGVVALVDSPAAESDAGIGLICAISQGARR